MYRLNTHTSKNINCKKKKKKEVGGGREGQRGERGREEGKEVERPSLGRSRRTRVGGKVICIGSLRIDQA